jgi:uncharacterized protein
MPDPRKMTVQSLRELARKVLGPGHTRLKTKTELLDALEHAGATPPPTTPASSKTKTPATRVRAAAAKAVAATGKALKATGKAVKATGTAVRAVKAAAGKAAEKVPRARGAKAAAAGAKPPAKQQKAKKAGKVAKAAAKVAGAALGAAAGAATAAASVRPGAGAKKRGAKTGAPRAARKGKETPGTDPEGFFVARVRGEDAVRDAPHPLVESAEVEDDERNGVPVAPIYPEGLGELPWGYGDDAFVGLPRDPRTLFLYWDLGKETLDRGLGGLDHPRTQLWVYARSGASWDRVRVLEFALEARGYYVHDLEPGRLYRAEIHVLDRQGQDRVLARSSNEVSLPPVGPSPIVDDRFIRIPWEIQLGRLLGPGHPGGAFPEDVRAMLARLSDWSRFAGKSVWGGSAGGMGGRPSSPSAAPSSPAPTSPTGPFGGEK